MSPRECRRLMKLALHLGLRPRPERPALPLIIELRALRVEIAELRIEIAQVVDLLEEAR